MTAVVDVASAALKILRLKIDAKKKKIVTAFLQEFELSRQDLREA